MKKVKFKIDNKSRDFGSYDEKTRIVKINKVRNDKYGNRGELLDTIYHEIAHAKHPKMKEQNIRKFTEKNVKRLTKKAKSKLYGKIEKKGRKN